MKKEKEKRLSRRKFFITTAIISLNLGWFRRFGKKLFGIAQKSSVSYHPAQFYQKL